MEYIKKLFWVSAFVLLISVYFATTSYANGFIESFESGSYEEIGNEDNVKLTPEESTLLQVESEAAQTAESPLQQETTVPKDLTETSQVARQDAATLGDTFLPEWMYFEVIVEKLAVYSSADESSKILGYLDGGQSFPRIADLGTWHKIKFGNGYGYVLESKSLPTDKEAIANLNTGLLNTSNSFFPKTALPVYDNSSGKLIPFATLEKGIQYPIISDYGDWYKIDVAGRVGFVYKPGTTRPFLPTDRFFEVTADKVSIYDNSGGTLKHVGYLTKGQVYPRVADYGDWHKVKFGSGYGYVWEASTIPATSSSLKNLNNGLINTNRKFIALEALAVFDNSSGQLIPFGTIEKGVQYPIVSDYGDWYRIDLSGRIGFVYKPATKIPFTTADKYFQVIEPLLPVYDNSTGKLVHVGYLLQNQVYPRVSDYGDWHKLSYGNGFGFVWKEATKPVTNPSLKNLNTGQKNTASTFKALETLAVYDNSSGKLVEFARLFKGVKYPILSNYGEWYKIDVSGRIGFVYEPATQRDFKASDQFFQVIEEKVGIYENKAGSLVHVGYLIKDGVYPRVSDYGDWHKIKFGRDFAFVWKEATRPVSGSSLKNINDGLNLSGKQFKSITEVTVYESTMELGGRNDSDPLNGSPEANELSGPNDSSEANESLIPFGTLVNGTVYPFIEELDDLVKVDLAGRIGYVKKVDVEFLSGQLVGKVIVLDAGHGGVDGGTSGKNNLEKTLNLETVEIIASILEQEGATVILTRDSDNYVSLEDRVKVCTNSKPDAFISIHYNASTVSSVNGIETYYYTSNKELQLAQNVHKGLAESVGLKDRGVKYGNLFVLRENKYPAILLELGFLSNPEEEKIVATQEYRQKVATGILSGLIAYFN